MSLQEIITEYLAIYAKKAEKALKAYARCTSYEQLIERAIVGFLANGNRDSHKFRLSKEVMLNMKLYLLAKRYEIQRSRTFKDIMNILYDARTSGWGIRFGPLWIYDTALAIAAYLKLEPEADVYLHAGAYQGALNIFGPEVLQQECWYFRNDPQFPVLPLSVFPEELGQLRPHHVENLLCIYKEKLTSAVLKPTDIFAKGTS